MKNELTKRLHIKYPIIQAPMAGGITTPELVAAVSNSGGLGMVGAGYMTPEQIRKLLREIKELTENPFGINLFVPNEFQVTDHQIQVAQQKLDLFRKQLKINQNDSIEVPSCDDVFQNFADQIKVVIEEKVTICSFTFGIPSKQIIGDLKKCNITLMGTAATVSEAIANEKAGMDIVVAQGSEAGGHRGSFINGEQDSLIGLMSLIPQVVDTVSIPVIAAGGIMDGRGLTAAVCLGAKAVQMGTAFLTCIESGAHQVYKEAILSAREDETVLTRSFSGKYARGIRNTFISEMQDYEMHLPEYPAQNTLTQDIRKNSASQNNPEFMSLWSGQSPRLAKKDTVDTLIKNTIAEAKGILKIGDEW